MPPMALTLEMSHAEMSRSKLVASLNLPTGRSVPLGLSGSRRRTDMYSMVVTLEVSHSETSPLKLVAR